MRYKNNISYFRRTLKSGKKVIYYRLYDKDGKRTVPKSTGETSLTKAKNLCSQLSRAGKLLPEKELIFKDFACNWWVFEKCQYIKSRIEKGFPLAHSYADYRRRNLEKHILPTFENIKLNDITSKKIENWQFKLKESGLQNRTVNLCWATLRIMLNEAYRLDLISKNPAKSIRSLNCKKKKKSILTQEEIDKLFKSSEIENIWISKDYYILNLLAAGIGARLGEIQALCAENISTPNYVIINHSYNRKYGLTDTKTHDIRKLPIHPELYKMLDSLRIKNPGGFLFSANKGKTPFNSKCITEAFYKALAKIGITEQERKSKNLSFHSWRYCCNTNMRVRITDPKLRCITGHTTDQMTNHYTTVTGDDLKAFVSYQESLFLAPSKDKAQAGGDQ